MEIKVTYKVQPKQLATMAPWAIKDVATSSCGGRATFGPADGVGEQSRWEPILENFKPVGM